MSINLWQLAGIPVIGSSLPFSCDMVHDGDIRRSDEAFSEEINRGISAELVAAIKFAVYKYTAYEIRKTPAAGVIEGPDHIELFRDCSCFLLLVCFYNMWLDY